MKSIERKAFANMEEFREYTKTAPLVYFHIFQEAPNQDILDALSECGGEEALVLLDVASDRGFLKNTNMTVEVTEEHQFVYKPLAELRGVGAWAMGNPVDFVADAGAVKGIIRVGRRFAFKAGHPGHPLNP